ncbi:MAG TPA: hypothetical protein VL693_09935 [Vicinamibacterales bacterium]|jgi:hypothetical protein|nr:hypothetical protein [Vicinamibacterales bacterium]
MRKRLLQVAGVAAVIVAVIVLLKLAPAGSASASAALKTAWGDPDLQGIWTDDYQTPLQRPVKYANKPEFTEQERAELDQQRAAILRRNQRVEVGTERDVAGAYNAVFQSIKHTGKRTSLIVDPPDGRIPPLTAEAKQRADTDRQFRLALLQATATCKNGDTACAGGKYGPPSPRYKETPPFYNTGRLNRSNGPEDRSMTERCMAAVLPDFTGYRRIVQGPGTVSIFYDVGQGQGWQRVITLEQVPHLPSNVRQRFGDSRGHWEGNTLVVDVTNFSPKSDFQGARQNLHLVERWTRTDAKTLEYQVTIEDPTTWTKSWTVKQEMNRQDEQANRVYYEPRCHEGNYGLPALLSGTRAEEAAFAAGKGPDPATKDSATDFGAEGGVDALAGGG